MALGPTCSQAARADTFVMTNDGARDTVNGTAERTPSTTSRQHRRHQRDAGTRPTAVQVLGTGTAGTTTDLISNIDNVVGGSGNDTITGDGRPTRWTGNGGAEHR